MLELEAVAECDSIEQVYERLEERQRGASHRPVGAAVDVEGRRRRVVGELEQLRRIENVVRLGHVERIDLDAITLEHGSIPTSPDHLHVHCASAGLSDNPPKPIFTDDTITLQPITRVSLTLSDRADRLRRGVGPDDGREEPARARRTRGRTRPSTGCGTC